MERHTFAATPEELERLRATGCFIRDGFFAPDEIDRLVEAADRAVAFRNERLDGYKDVFRTISTKDGFIFVNELADDSPWRGEISRFCLDDRVAAMARSLAGPDAAHCCYQLVYKYPRHAAPFAWHQDEVHTPADPTFYNMWVAISDMDVDNGCLWTKPGHGLDRVLPHRQTPHGLCCWPLEAEDQGVPLPMKRGAICVMSSRTLHKSNGNHTDAPRKAMLIVFMDRNATVYGKTVPTVEYR